MVAFSDLTQVMQNARTDAKTLDEYVHGAADAQVTSRLGKRYWTLATLDNKLSLVKIKAEKTLADIDTLAKSATDSITAKSNSANTAIDSKAAQADSDISAKVANANTAIDAKVASIDTRADSEIANLQSAINTAAAAAAGANGWTATLVKDASGKTQQQINDGLNSVDDLSVVASPRLGQRFYVKSYHNSLNAGGGVFTLIDTAQVVDNGIVFASQDAGKKWVRAEQTYLTPDMFGAKPNDPSFDNTDALNRAFATGRVIYGKKDDVYYVNGILNTKGQQLLGGWKISTSRYNLGVVSTEVEPIDENRIRTIYVGDATDLSELLFIKNMGFNTINFYGGQSNVQQLLDNALAAKLRVNLNTEHGEASSDYVAFIKKYDNHPSVWAYTAYDEPATRGISVAQQDTKIAAMKAVTKKPITMVDLILNDSPFVQFFSQNYDIVFVDSYAQRRTGDITSRVNADLEKMRLNYALVGAMTKAPKVIPVIGTFLFKGAHYTDDITQVLKSSEVFAKVDGGNYGAFVWDGQGDTNITSDVRSNPQLVDFLKNLNKQRDIAKPNTDILLFGGRDSETDWGVTQLFSLVKQKDSTSTDEPINGFSYPITLKKSTNETNRTTATLPSDVQSISGIGFFGNWAASVLNIKLRKNMRICLRIENTVPSGVTNFALFETTDNGYNNTILWQDDRQSASVLTYEPNLKPKNPDANLVILVREPNATVQQYRKILMGYIIAADW